ncbi:MAG: hypothetical protein FJ161_00185 [Gammaproteobacteria bacterium]|nr:hypothetical protein [Gammaproteobacteria bacterium]
MNLSFLKQRLILIKALLYFRLRQYLNFAIPIVLLCLLLEKSSELPLLCISWIYMQGSTLHIQWDWIEWLTWHQKSSLFLECLIMEHILIAGLLGLLCGSDYLLWSCIFFNLLCLKTFSDFLGHHHFSYGMAQSLTYLITIPWFIMIISTMKQPHGEVWIFLASAIFATLLMMSGGRRLMHYCVYPFEWSEKK